MRAEYSELAKAGSNQVVVELVQSILEDEWQQLSQELIDRQVLNFHRNLRLSREQEGGNNYNIQLFLKLNIMAFSGCSIVAI